MRSFVFLLSLLFCFPAMAAEKPEFLEPYVKAEEPAGKATLRKFLIKVYDGVLWADDGVDYSKPFALALTYDVRIDSEDFIARTIEEIEASSGQSAKELERWKPELAKVFPAVKAGDTITAVNLPKKGVQFYFNGKMTGQIKDAQFAKLFFDIWLSPTTSEPSFRRSLLGIAG